MNRVPNASDRIDRFAGALERVIDWVEIVVAVILAAVIVMAVFLVAAATIRVVGSLPKAADGEGVFQIIKYVLDTFLVIELFRITVAYVRHHDIIPTVLETALVVSAREIVVIEAGAKQPLAAAAVGGTLVAVGIAWYLLRRAGAFGADKPESDR